MLLTLRQPPSYLSMQLNDSFKVRSDRDIIIFLFLCCPSHLMIMALAQIFSIVTFLAAFFTA